MKKSVILAALAVVGLAGQQAQAAVDWTISMTSGSNTNPAPAYGNTRSYASGTTGVTVSAFSATGGTSTTSSSNTNRNSNTIETAYLSIYTPSSGLGVVNRDGSNTSSVAVTSSATGSDSNEFINNGSEHSMDNHGRSDVMLLTFTDQIALQSLKLGWVGTDSDVFVLAWSGTNTFSSASQLATTTFAQIAADTADGLDNGWKFITNQSNVGTTSAASFNTTTPVFSSYWLIGTGGFNSAMTGGGVTSGDRSNGSWIGFGTSGANYDYVKLASVGGVGMQLPLASVPEPGSLALASAAFLGMFGMRRRKAAV